MSELDQDTAREWVTRWERQQEDYLPDREERFTALIDAVRAGAGRAASARTGPLVVDLGCGPGSLSVRLLDRIPDATVLAVDADPVMLALGRAAYDGRPGLRFVDADLRVPGWSAKLALDRKADAAVSTTALHWLREPELRAMYLEAAGILRLGGLLLDGDHLALDEVVAPVLADLERALRAEQERRGGARHESWHDWWEAVAADPVFADAVAERERRGVESGHHGPASASMLLDTHVAALRSAAFTEVATLWQCGDNRLLCAVR